MKKKLGLLAMVVALMAIATGCSETGQPITSKSTGIWNEYFVYPLSQLITYFADLFNSNYGLAIVITTLIIRFALLPLMIKQTKSTKAMQALQPEMVKLKRNIALKIKRHSKTAARNDAVISKNGVNPLAGCLPIFIQMPILFAFIMQL